MLRYDVVMIVFGLLIAVSSVGGQEPPKAEDFILPTREEFLRKLKLEKPELAAVKAALDKGDVEAAGKAYIAYFRTKEISGPMLTDWSVIRRNPDYNTSRADSFLAGHLMDDYYSYDVPKTGIDWYDCPLLCITRFPILSYLRSTLYHTGDPKYLRFAVDHILEYLDAYPIQEFVGKGLIGYRGENTVCLPWHWRMIDTRLLEMAQTVKLIRKYPQATDEELLRILQRMYEETTWMRMYMKTMVDGRGNGALSWIWRIMSSSMALEDFAASSEWMECATRSLVQYVDEAFYPDGGCIELATAYSGVVTIEAQRAVYAMREAQGMREGRDKLTAMITWAIALAKPTGRIPSFGDCNATHFRSSIYKPILKWLDLPGWVDTMVYGTDGPLPPFLVWPVEGQEQWSGYYVMRSDWTKDARFMMIDCGPWGISHQHGDRLSFVVTAYGADLIIDPTSTIYHSDKPDALLSRQNASFLHNTITVDDVDEYRADYPVETKEPLHNRWEHGDNYTLFAGEYSFAPLKAVNWERRVVFADRSYWLLQDVLTGDQESAQIEQNFQFDKDIDIEFQENMTIAKAPNGARLVIKPLASDLNPILTVGDKTPHITYWPDGKPRGKDEWVTDASGSVSHGRGWTGRNSHKLMPAPAVTYVGEVRLPEMLTMALIPVKPGQSLDDMPKIASEAANGKTTWSLPVKEGVLQFVTSVEECHIVKP